MADSQKYGRTAQLFNYDTSVIGGIGSNGEDVWSDSARRSDYIQVKGGSTYTLSGNGGNIRFFVYDENKNYLNDNFLYSAPFTISNNGYIRFAGGLSSVIDTIMLNEGSTALPYQPYIGWVHSLRKLCSATEAVENPLYSDGTAITAYTIKGNTVQNGTPTPSNPVDVNGVGERTENLFDDTNVINIPNLGDRYGVELPSGTYSIYNDTDNTVYYGTNNWTGRQKACDAHSTATVELRVGSETQVGGFFIALNSASQGGCTIVEGSTPPDHYIPYGYKIPISTLQTSAVNYLGSVQSTRQIKKFVFDGTETLSIQVQPPLFIINIPTNYFIPQVTALCTEYNYNPVQSSILANSQHGDFGLQYVSVRDEYNVWFNNSTFATNADFKAYLAQQYANGTPVTVWYVLATPNTATVNEPLMKIGTYADTLSNAVSIPTTEGANSITVDTTVQPSEFTATWTGWHDSSVKEYDGTNWQ